MTGSETIAIVGTLYTMFSLAILLKSPFFDNPLKAKPKLKIMALTVFLPGTLVAAMFWAIATGWFMLLDFMEVKS